MKKKTFMFSIFFLLLVAGKQTDVGIMVRQKSEATKVGTRVFTEKVARQQINIKQKKPACSANHDEKLL